MLRLAISLMTSLGVMTGMTQPANAQDGTYGKYETPSYSVVRTYGSAEIRRYAPHILAQVAVRGERRGALNQGFRVLAGYIFGGNAGDTSVAMTAPVTQSSTNIAMTAPVGQSGDGDVWTVTFMMPTQYTLETLPTPDSDAVRFIQVPAKDMIALTFSGRATTRALDAQTQTLRRIITEHGLTARGEPVYMFYDDPFTLPAARRNEVAFEID